MSKEAALRAMREARYNEMSARSSPASRPTRPAVRPPQVAPAEVAEELCGHRSMNGRTCTREQGHEAKSHRYS